jgi:chemotaxis protein CheZ
MSDQPSEPAVYKQLTADMRQGLRDIYRQIYTASKDQPLPGPATDALFHEASDQLDEVLKATESATMSIMEIVERHLDLQAQNTELLAAVRQGTATPSQVHMLEENNSRLGDDLTTLLTTLSFQDITGQRIKRVVDSLNQIESTVVELYISSGLMLRGRKTAPRRPRPSCATKLPKP